MESFSAEELQQLREAFNVFDRDASGAIDATEFALAAAEFGVQISSEEVTDIFARYDKDQSGSIEFPEFAMVMADKLHAGEGDSDSESSDDSDDGAGSPSGSPTNAASGQRQFDKLSRDELAVKSAWLSKLEADIVEDLREAQESTGAAADDADDDDGLSGPMLAVARRVGAVYRMLRTHRKVLPFSDLPPGAARYAAHFDGSSATLASATGHPEDAEPLTAEGTAEDARTMMEYLRDSVAAIGERVESLDSLEVVAMHGLHPEPERVDPFRCTTTPPRFVQRGEKRAATLRGKAAITDAAGLNDALRSLAGFQFDNAAAASDCAQAGGTVPAARHAREHVCGLDDVPNLSGAEAYRWFVRNKLRYGICVVDPVCEQIDAADDLHEQLAEALANPEGAPQKPRCPDGRDCQRRRQMSHRAEYVHPCFCDADPIGADDGDIVSAARACPLASRRTHMQSCYHSAVGAKVERDVRLAELNAVAGTLDVSGIGLNDEAAEAIAFVLQRAGARAGDQRRHTSLIASRNRISPAGARALLDAASELQTLDLGRNCLGSRSAVLAGGGSGPALSRLLQRSVTLTHLDLSSNGLSDGDGHDLCEALKTNVVLRTLILRNNNFGRATGYDLAAAISYNRELKHLDVSYNRFDAVGTHALLEELGETSTFEFLDLSWTGVTDASAEHVARLISGGSSLRTLRLGHNALADRGGAIIGKSLPGSRSLVRLDLSHNPLGDGGLGALLREVASNTSIELLDVQHVRASDTMSAEVAQTMAARAERVPRQNILFLA